MDKVIKHGLFGLVFVSLWIPVGDKLFGLLPDWPLDGSYETLPEPEFNTAAWFEGIYQNEVEPWLNEQLGVRNYLIRLRNQYYFSVFGIALANGVSPGKEGVLLDAGYVDAFYGKDFAGETFLKDKLKRWKRVQAGLDSLGVKGFLCLAPGKGSFFEEQFSDALKDKHEPITNYGFITQWAKNNDVRTLDLKQVYHTWHDTSRYPLFPKGGIHWSEYGVAHVCDTLRGYIQHITGRPLQEFWFDVELSDTARGVDNDIAVGMNLLFTPKQERLAYPIRYFGEDTTIEKTRLLTIADSYYYNIVYSGFADRVCSFGGFWYYFKTTYPGELFQDRMVDELDLLEELKKQDVIMLMMTEPQLQRFGWGAVEAMENALFPTEEESDSPG